MNDLEQAAAETIAAYREHQAYLLVGGHEPKRVSAAVDDLEIRLRKQRQPEASK